MSSRAETLAYPQITETNLQEIISSFKGNISAMNGKIYICEQNFDIVMRKFSKDDLLRHNKDENVVCSICFEEFKEESECRLTPCGHVFHRECIYTWIIKNDKRKCPNDNFKFKKTS